MRIIVQPDIIGYAYISKVIINYVNLTVEGVKVANLQDKGTAALRIENCCLSRQCGPEAMTLVVEVVDAAVPVKATNAALCVAGYDPRTSQALGQRTTTAEYWVTSDGNQTYNTVQYRPAFCL